MGDDDGMMTAITAVARTETADHGNGDHATQWTPRRVSLRLRRSSRRDDTSETLRCGLSCKEHNWTIRARAPSDLRSGGGSQPASRPRP